MEHLLEIATSVSTQVPRKVSLIEVTQWRLSGDTAVPSHFGGTHGKVLLLGSHTGHSAMGN